MRPADTSLGELIRRFQREYKAWKDLPSGSAEAHATRRQLDTLLELIAARLESHWRKLIEHYLQAWLAAHQSNGAHPLHESYPSSENLLINLFVTFSQRKLLSVRPHANLELELIGWAWQELYNTQIDDEHSA